MPEAAVREAWAAFSDASKVASRASASRCSQRSGGSTASGFFPSRHSCNRARAARISARASAPRRVRHDRRRSPAGRSRPVALRVSPSTRRVHPSDRANLFDLRLARGAERPQRRLQRAVRARRLAAPKADSPGGGALVGSHSASDRYVTRVLSVARRRSVQRIALSDAESATFSFRGLGRAGRERTRSHRRRAAVCLAR